MKASMEPVEIAVPTKALLDGLDRAKGVSEEPPLHSLQEWGYKSADHLRSHIEYLRPWPQAIGVCPRCKGDTHKTDHFMARWDKILHLCPDCGEVREPKPLAP